MALLAIIGAVIQPVTEVCKCVLVPIKQQASYFICYKKYVDNFKRKAEKLELRKNDVQGSVVVARRNSEVVLDTVNEWLSRVEDIIADVQRLDNQLQGNIRCFDLRMQYKLGKEAKEKIETVDDLQRNGNFSSVSHADPNTCILSLPDGDFYKSESTELAMKQVMDALKDKDTNIIGVYGMGGVGKTTLIKQVAKWVKRVKLYEEVVLVTLPQNPDLRRIQSDIADELGLKLEEGNEYTRASKLSERLCQAKNVLLILDNLWARVDLADVGIPHGKECEGCNIIFTTRSKEVCDVMESQVRIAVDVLSEQDSWSLFREKAGGIVDTPALHDLAWKVAKECGGLPLAIVTLGRALRNKEEHVWKNALLELQRSNPANIKDMNAIVFTSLEMSYNYLDSEEAKSFFLLCSLLSQGNYILINDLIRYGMGEGLFCDVNTLEEASVRVHTLIDRLEASCLLLEGEGDNRVRMHDVVHDVATSMASRHEHAFFVKDAIGLKDWPENENLKKCKRIVLAENNLEMLPADSISCPRLLTLSLDSNYSLKKIPESFFIGMKALRVLDLCSTNISSLPLSIECLENLRTLWLDRCRELKDVAVICKLKKLEILCLKQSGVDKLPKEISELTNLKLLDLSNTKLEIVPPNVISMLTRLEELYMGDSFNQWEPEGAEDARQASIAEFEFLKHLRVLDVHIETLSCMPQSSTSGPWKNTMKFQICIGGDYNYKSEYTNSAMIQVMDALKDKDTNIIGVYGLGGVGKTTLMKQVVKLVKREKLYEEVVMVTLPQNPDLRRIQSDIAVRLGLKMPLKEGNEHSRACKLLKRLRQFKNVLLILDNLWGRLDLADVGIPRGEECKGCNIIFTTRSTKVCDVMEGQVRIAVTVLSEQDSWSLFRKKAGPIVDSTPALHDLALKVAKECGGLPLAILVVGAALSSKDEIVWKNALQELQRSNPANIMDMYERVLVSLELSYKYLESEEAKSLFLLCSLFPEGYHISRDDLIRYGMGEGLFRNVNTLEEASVKVHALIDKLKHSCLLLEGESDDQVKMHDLVHNAATSIATRYEHGFFVKNGAGLKEWPEIENLEECKRISLSENNLQMLPADSISYPQLLTLTLDCNYYLKKIPESFFRGMKVLNVLDLCDTNISSLPLSMECLENLRTLWLDRCRELKDVAVICKLKKLEILCLKQSGVDKLPKEISELTNLKLLDLSNTKLEIVPPNVISRLTRLEELYMGHSFSQWELEGAEDARQASIAEFEFLKHLRVLDVHIKTLSCMPQSSTSGPWKNLMKFQICIGGDYMCFEEKRYIKVENISFPIPYSVQSLFDIANTLCFVRCRGLTNLADRQELRGESLETLVITDCAEMECVISMEEKASPLKFKSLKSLHLVRLENLKTICNGPPVVGCLENLRVLKVLFCNNLLINILPSYLVKALQNLEELYVDDCQELQEVFNSEGLVEQHAVLTNFKRLRLKRLPSLSSIWKGAMPIGSLHNLGTLMVENCGLRYLFSPAFPQFAAQLADLRIKDCEKMENLIMEENFPSQSPAIGCFQNLKILVIHKCHGFKSLFSSSSARELECLEYLEVHSCDGMEVIIRKGEEVADKGVLPRLEILALSCLPKLTNFYEEACILNFHSLKYFGLWSCPELEWVPLGPQSAPNLKQGVISSEWTELEQLKWNDKRVKSRLQNLFVERPSFTHFLRDPFKLFD